MSICAIDMYPSPPGPEMVPMRWPWATVLPEARSRAVERHVEDGDSVAITGIDEHPAAATVDPLHRARNRGEDQLPGGVTVDSRPVERVFVLGKIASVRVGPSVVTLHHLPLTTGHRPGNPGALTFGPFRGRLKSRGWRRYGWHRSWHVT